jgi:hypothetical protein
MPDWCYIGHRVCVDLDLVAEQVLEVFVILLFFVLVTVLVTVFVLGYIRLLDYRVE